MSAKERGDQNAVVDALRSIQPAVFIPASVVIVAMIVVSVVYSSVAENAFVRLNSAITGGVGVVHPGCHRVCGIRAVLRHFPDWHYPAGPRR